MAVGIGKIGIGQRDHFARTQHRFAIDEYIRHFAAIGAAIHAYEAAHGAGDAAKKFKARDALIARRAGHRYAAGPAAAAHRHRVQPHRTSE